MRLFCLPHAGGTSRIFKPWTGCLGPDTELVALDLAGNGVRADERRLTTLASAADDLAGLIADRSGGDDYALYGHSMGALLVYEIAHRLAERGVPAPRMLFVAACRPPGSRWPGPMLHTFPDEAFLGALAAMGGVPVEALHNSALIKFYTRLVRPDYRISEEYAAAVEPRPLTCPVSVIVGDYDPVVPAGSAPGWAVATTAQVSVLTLDGAGHFFDDRVEEICKHIESTLAALAAPGPPAGPAPVAPAADLLGRLRLADVRLSASESGLSYDAPEGAVDDALLKQMAEHKDELAALVVAGGPVEASGPMSYGQRRHVAQVESSSEPAGFNIAMRLSITGPLDVPALERALTALVARHGGLRTRLLRRGGHFVQERLAPAPVPLPFVDYGDLPPQERGPAAEEWLAADARTPFPMGEETLFRAGLARLGPEAWELILVVQHTVSDAWSNATILRDLAELYRSGGDSRSSPASDLLEFARWEAEYYQGTGFAAHKKWWVDRLAPAPLSFKLPTDRPRDRKVGERGELHVFTIPAPLADAVRRYADSLGGTEFAVLFAVFLQWLAARTGQRDLTVPTNYANRMRREFEDVTGCFVDIIAIRVELDDDEPFDTLVRRVGATLFESVDRFLPFGMVAEALIKAGKDVKTFTPVPFVVLNTPPMHASLGDLDVEFTLLPTGGAKGELAVVLEPEDGGWQGFVPYQTDLHDAATIEGWFVEYVELLERRIVGEPDELRPAS
jgi:surfactin synthase thioesterase subunit